VTFDEFMARRFPGIRDEGDEVTVSRMWLRGFWLSALEHGDRGEARRHCESEAQYRRRHQETLDDLAEGRQ